MKGLKSYIGMLLIGMLVFSGAFLSQAEQGNPRTELTIVLSPEKDAKGMTFSELTDILIRIMAIKIPADTETLSDAEVFEIQANMLAERGIKLFMDTNPESLVTCEILANLLYDALVDPSDATVQEKINYLADLGYLTCREPSAIPTASNVISALNIPELSKAFAEGYSYPAGLEREVGFTGIDIAPSNPAPESIVKKGISAAPTKKTPAGSPPHH